MKKIEQFQITGMTISGFKSYEQPTQFTFGNPTIITGGNGRGKSSIADAVAFVITGLPFFGERGIDRLHNESNPDVAISLEFIDEQGVPHELSRSRRKNRMTITYDGYEIRQLDLTDMFGERDVFLSIFNPLYFIEELGDAGKNLLEMYLPMIPHEQILAGLPEPVRAELSGEDMVSPEGYLKKRREAIRELKEHMTYLGGQKDLAWTQAQNRSQASTQLKQRQQELQTELSALEEKQFSGLNRKEMQERLVELSLQYEEAARDCRGDRSKNEVQIRTLQEKIAQRQAEQYQSKFTQPLAETAIKLKELGEQYQREAKTFQSLTPGTACPTCHRPITAEILPQIQTEVKKAASAILVAGNEQQEQLKELQALDKRSAETFEQFKKEDIEKWQAELDELTAGAPSGDKEEDRLTGLRTVIQSLTADLEYGNLSQAEYDRMSVCREDLKACQAELAALEKYLQAEETDYDAQIARDQAEIAELEKKLANGALYISKRAELTFSQLKMNRVEFSLYDVVKSTGEVKDTFKFTYGGRRYDRLSLSEKIRAGMEVSELMKRLTGRNYPVFVDNLESVDDLDNVHPTGQLILAKCVSRAPLQVRPLNHIATQQQRAA